MWQAGELLRHSHLQPYVLKIHLKINSPRRNSLLTHWPETDFIKKTRFDVPPSTYREKRMSFGNDRTLNPSISIAEQDSPYSTKRFQNTPSYWNQRMAELSVGSTQEVRSIGNKASSKDSNVAKNSRFTPTKASATPKRQVGMSKNRVSVRMYILIHLLY